MIKYYFSALSPYAYLAGIRLQEIGDKHGQEVLYKPLDLFALFARTGGQPPTERHPNRQAWRAQELPRAAKKAGYPLELKPPHVPTNQAPANYAIIAAQNAGGGDLPGLAHSFGRAAWAGGKDIAEDAVIRALLDAAGFDPSLADSGLLTAAETYSRNLEEAVADGAFGAPFYITEDDQRFWGHDRLDDLDAHLTEAS